MFFKLSERLTMNTTDWIENVNEIRKKKRMKMSEFFVKFSFVWKSVIYKILAEKKKQ